MNLGAHVSIAGGIDKAIDRGELLNCSSIQIFPGPPQTWRPTVYDRSTTALFKQKHTHSNIVQVFIHAIYLCNLGSPDLNLYEKSINAVKNALQLQVDIGGDGVIVHPGSHRGTDRKKGLQRVIDATHRLLTAVPKATLIFESSAGAGDTLGDTLEDLRFLIRGCAKLKRVGICLDTCHMFTSGIDIRSPKAQNECITTLNKLNLLAFLKVLHINDSAHPFASHRDVHANIGEGKIGLTALRSFVTHQAFKGFPLILETPVLKTIASATQAQTSDAYTVFNTIRRRLTRGG